MEVRAVLEAPAMSAHKLVDPDAEAVAATRADPSAFLALYDRYFERVLGYVRVRIRDAATCEDITSEVFTKALAQIGRFRGEGSFAAWLFQIARNAVRDLERRAPLEPIPPEATNVPDARRGPEELVLVHERVERLHSVLSSLEPEQQHLLALRYGAGLSFDEIGVILDAAPGTVRVRVHRVLEELRRRYPNDDQ